MVTKRDVHKEKQEFLNKTYALDKMFTRKNKKIKDQNLKIIENLERGAEKYGETDRIGRLIIDQDVRDYLGGFFGSDKEKMNVYWNHYNFLKKKFI